MSTVNVKRMQLLNDIVIKFICLKFWSWIKFNFRNRLKLHAELYYFLKFAKIRSMSLLFSVSILMCVNGCFFRLSAGYLFPAVCRLFLLASMSILIVFVLFTAGFLRHQVFTLIFNNNVDNNECFKGQLGSGKSSLKEGEFFQKPNSAAG